MTKADLILSTPRRPLRRAASRHAGFTLIELMISMVIGLLIVLAMMTLLINVNRNNTELSKSHLVIENGRFALQLLGDDLSHVGYLGGYMPRFDDMSYTLDPATVGASAIKAALNVPTAVPDPCLAYASWTAAVRTNLMGIGVQGHEIPATGPLSVCADRVVSPQASTDVLIVRHAERTANCNPEVLNVPGQDDCPLPTENELYIQTQWCGDNAPAVPYVLQQYVAADQATTFPLMKRDCATSAEKRRFVSNLYYIRNYAVTEGDGIPTLMRSEFGPDVVAGAPVLQHRAAQALIEGIEGFRVEFGVDSLSDTAAAVNFSQAITWADKYNLKSPMNRGDGLPDGAYVHCTTTCTVDQLMNVVAVRIYVLVRSERATAGYTDTKTYTLGGTTLGPFRDGFKRHLFTQTVRLTNVSSRRETPT